jgi:hypothetical protein
MSLLQIVQFYIPCTRVPSAVVYPSAGILAKRIKERVDPDTPPKLQTQRHELSSYTVIWEYTPPHKQAKTHIHD